MYRKTKFHFYGNGMGKEFQSYGLLKYLWQEQNSKRTPRHEKNEFYHKNGKRDYKTTASYWSLQVFGDKARIHTILKVWEKIVVVLRENYGKTRVACSCFAILFP